MTAPRQVPARHAHSYGGGQESDRDIRGARSTARDMHQHSREAETGLDMPDATRYCHHLR